MKISKSFLSLHFKKFFFKNLNAVEGHYLLHVTPFSKQFYVTPLPHTQKYEIKIQIFRLNLRISCMSCFRFHLHFSHRRYVISGIPRIGVLRHFSNPPLYEVTPSVFLTRFRSRVFCEGRKVRYLCEPNNMTYALMETILSIKLNQFLFILISLVKFNFKI